MTNSPRYGVLAAAYAAELRRLSPERPVVAGTGRVFATYAAELLEARAAARAEDVVPVALRRWRKSRGLSQRAAAEALEVSASLVSRAESRPGVLKVGALLALLRSAGYDLAVVDREGVSLAEDLRAEEILARTRDGRRFSGTKDVVRLSNEPRWLAERGQSFQTHGPQWTGEPRPGQYP